MEEGASARATIEPYHAKLAISRPARSACAVLASAQHSHGTKMWVDRANSLDGFGLGFSF